MDDQRALEQKALMKILHEHFKELTSFEGVTSAGVGLRVRGGEYTDELCIYVEVLKKLPPSAVKVGQLIPTAVEGVHVDVVERRDAVLEHLLVKVEDLADQDKVRPLQGGYQITNGIEVNGYVSTGTLGAMIYIPDKKQPYIGIMSNQHVMYSHNARDGQSIGQPWGDAIIGTNVGGIKDSEVDFAVARMANNVAATNTVRLIGALKGFSGAVVGQRVRKCGKTTGLTVGQITKVGVWCDEVICVYTGLEMVQGWPTRDSSVRFSGPGDSGSVIVDNDNNVLGLHFAGTTGAPYVSYSNDIRRVRQRAGAFQVPIPGVNQMIQVLADVGRLRRYQRELEKTGRGAELLAAVVENVEECVHLVNSQRECVVAWQRNKGPAFISLQRGLDDSEPYVLRKEIDGVTMDEMLRTMRRLFVKHGSPRVVEALGRFGDELIEFAAAHDTMDDIVRAVGTLP